MRRTLAVLLACAATTGIGCFAPPPAALTFEGKIEPSGDKSFAIVGDLQTTSFLEFWREQNDIERALVVKQIATARPAFLVMLGDLVFNGSSEGAWADFDALCTPIREARIPVLAVPGNHEYWFGGSLDHYFKRFPHLKERTFYEVTHGPVALVFLNSNIDNLPEWEMQLAWYRAELARIDADPNIRGALVMMHHPPYTNSTVTSDEAHVGQWLVPPFKAAKKTLAMITGHVHSYERFVYDGKMFVVSGGGGGPRAALSLDDHRRHPEDLYKGPAVRAFHYLSVTPAPTGLAVEVVGLSGEGRGFSTIDAFKMPWPDGGDRGGKLAKE